MEPYSIATHDSSIFRGPCLADYAHLGQHPQAPARRGSVSRAWRGRTRWA